jgi:signal transduction histidine kinase
MRNSVTPRWSDDIEDRPATRYQTPDAVRGSRPGFPEYTKRMVGSGRRKTIAFFITLGVCLVAAAVALNVGWVLLNWRTGVLLVFGVIFFLLIIAGVVLNTIFLVREIRRNEMHDAFINAVTHELKTPVASIRLYLETLQTRDLDEARRREFYGIMLDDSERLLVTIEQVLRAGKAVRRQPHRTPIDVSQIAQECLALARTRHHLPENALAFSAEGLGAEPAVVMGDPDDLKAAVSNLIDNAIKYSGDNVRVLVNVGPVEGRRIAVCVKDHGIGIPATELKRVFKRFYRLPDVVATRIKGTGLGLHIVQSVAARHGGRAFAESGGRGHGATFTLQLPMAPPPAPAGQP